MSKDEYKVDSKENSDYMYNILEKVLTEIGPRGSCSKEEKKSADFFVDELGKFCDSVKVENFYTYPQLSVHSWIPRSVIFILISTIIFVLFNSLNSLVVSLISIIILFFNLFLVYKHYLCSEMWHPKVFFFYKKRHSQNVYGITKPTGDVKKRVILAGHLDSAQRFNIAQYFREGYVYILLGAILTLFTFFIVYIIQFIYSIMEIFILGLDISIVATWMNWIILILLVGVSLIILIIDIISAFGGKKIREKILYGAISHLSRNNLILMIGVISYQVIINVILFNFIFTNPTLIKTVCLLFFNSIQFLIGMTFFASEKAVPGALDNLSACAIVSCVGKVLSDWKQKYPNLYPKNTEVILVMFGCEEVGVKGAEAFAEKHAEEFNKIDTTCIALDTIGDSELINIFSREGSTRIDFHPDVYNLLVECAKELNLNYKLSEQPFISGGTDGSGLVKKGLKRTAAFVGLRYSDYLYYYHTDRDNLGLINKDRRPCNDHGTSWKNRNIRCALENALKLLIRYIQKKDSE
ncbi:MAG: M28 family peptidase [Candidatus Helarchaeota archaeon]